MKENRFLAEVEADGTKELIFCRAPPLCSPDEVTPCQQAFGCSFRHVGAAVREELRDFLQSGAI